MRRTAHPLVRLILAFVLCWIAPAGAVEPPPAEKQPAAPVGWLEITPLDSDSPPQLASLFQEGRFPGKLEATGRVLACHAFDQAAITCRKVYLTAEEPLDLGPVEGVPVVGSIVLGRQPLEGAQVSLVPDGLDAVRFFRMPLSLDAKREKLTRAIPSDKRGHFALPAIAPGRYFLEVKAPGGRLLHGEAFRLPSPDELRGRDSKTDTPLLFDLGEVRFDEGVRVEVQVTDLAGAPVAGARVGANQGDRPTDADFYEAVADGAGIAVIDGLDPLARTGISCAAEGYRWRREELERPPARFSCVLEPLATLVGTVLGPDGEPFPGALAALAGPALDLPPGQSTNQPSSGDGTFEFVDLPAGAYRLTVAAAGYESQSQKLDLEPGARRNVGEIVLEPGGEWSGSVVDAISGKGIEGARVGAVRPAGAMSATTDRDGAFRVVSGVDQDLQLEVIAEGYPRTVVDIRATELREDEVPPVELSRGGQLRVFVWNSTEETPCTGCTVVVSDPTGELQIGLRTGVDGTAVSELLRPGEYRVTLERVGSKGSVVYRSGGDSVKHAQIHPLETTEVRFGEDSDKLLIRARPSLGDTWSLVASGPTGNEIRRLEGGRCRIARPLGRTRLALSDSAGTTIQVAVLPSDFSDPVLDLDLPGTEVAGILSIDGEPVDAQLVSFAPLGSQGLAATARTGQGGAFSVPYLAAGIYALIVGDQSVRTFSLNAGSRLDLGSVDLPSAVLEGSHDGSQ